MFVALMVNAATFKISEVYNGNEYDGTQSGSTVEVIFNTFTVKFPIEAQAVNYNIVLMADNGNSYYANASRIYPNSYYTSTEGSFTFDFWGSPLATDGTYTLTIPEGTFLGVDGSVNEEFTGTWTIKQPERFQVTNITNRGFAEGTKLKSLDMYFNVQGPNPIVQCDGSKIEMYRGNAAIGKFDGGIINDNGSCDIYYSQWYTGVEDGKNIGSTKTSGTYTLKFSVGAFRDSQNKVSEAFTATWTVSATAVEPTLGIAGVETESKSADTYDITGRKVTSATNNAVVIKNGKKYTKRK